MSHSDFLFELGCEELPPKNLKALSESLANSMQTQLVKAQLSYGEIQSFATPRRLSFIITKLAQQQPDKQETLYGPPANIAFDANGNPTKAALGFAQRAGVDASQLETADNGKLKLEQQIEGKQAAELLPDMLEQALQTLPIAKRMRWGQSRIEFVRPVHWLIMLLGEQVLECELLGLKASQQSRGHRFHANDWITIKQPSEYAAKLKDAYVIASFSERQSIIKQGVMALAKKRNGQAVIDDDLLDEVTALNEYPVPLAGSFDDTFLRVPPEALISSMKEHQKYFHLIDNKQQLLPHFITVANLKSNDETQVIAGNERVIRPRLADAMFFWDSDLKTPLAQQREKLKQVLWVKSLGSLYDKTERITGFVSSLAKQLNFDVALAERAGQLCKSDLLTQLVFEFTDLQGLAGKYYAQEQGEPSEVSAALLEQYQPAFAGDVLPLSHSGILLALGDRMDSLVGLFALGQIPSGSKDPFALRRASLGVLRILVEKQLNLDLRDLIELSAKQNWSIEITKQAKDNLLDYLLERFSSWYQEQNIAADIFQAVRATGISNPYDINARVQAVHEFSQSEQAPALAAANKRVANILQKNTSQKITAQLDNKLLIEPSEQQLADSLAAKQAEIKPMLQAHQYSQALSVLASLRPQVDNFFAEVMVMAEDNAIRQNRMALLYNLKQTFEQIADIAKLNG